MRAARDCVPLTDAQRDEAERHLKFCGYAANRFAKKYPRIARDEFLSAAFDGLADAVREFDESRGVPLEYFAPKRIRGACFDLMRRGVGGAIRVPRNGYAAGLAPGVISIDADARRHGRGFDFPDARPAPDAAIAADDQLEAMLVGLGSVGRFVFRKVYGPTAWSFREVADHLGLCPSRVCQIHAELLPGVARRAVRLGLGDAPIVKEPAPSRRHRATASSTPRIKRDGVDVAVDPALAAAFVLDSIRDGVRPPIWKTVEVAMAAGRPGADARERGALDAMLARLKPDRRDVMTLSYGLDGWMRPLKEVGRLMGWSNQRVFYAQQRALETLGEMHREANREERQ